MSKLTLTFIATVSVVAAFIASAGAQQICPAGKMANGECFKNIGLAQSVQKTVILMTQPKFSSTAPLTLPSEDNFLVIGQDHHEFRYLYRSPALRLGNVVP